MTTYVVAIESKFDAEKFDACYATCAPYVRQNIPLSRIGETYTEEDAEWMMRLYFQATDHRDDLLLISVHDDTGHILGYMRGSIDTTRKALAIDWILYNDDVNGSRAWVYDFQKSGALSSVLPELGVKRWYIHILKECAEKSSIAAGFGKDEIQLAREPVPNIIYKSPYGWEEE